jgi:hypothetical protein
VDRVLSGEASAAGAAPPLANVSMWAYINSSCCTGNELGLPPAQVQSLSRWCGRMPVQAPAVFASYQLAFSLQSKAAPLHAATGVAT